MNNCDKETEVCPYDKSHVILKSRMLTHLAKCSRNFPYEEQQPCIYNNKHVIPVAEMRYHLEECPDRGKIDMFKISVGNVECPIKKEFPMDTPNLPESEENWDDSPSNESVLNVIRYRMETIGIEDDSDVLLSNGVIGKSKSVRKELRKKQIKKLLNLKDNKKENTPPSIEKYFQTNESPLARLKKKPGLQKLEETQNKPIRPPNATTESKAMKLQKKRADHHGGQQNTSS